MRIDSQSNKVREWDIVHTLPSNPGFDYIPNIFRVEEELRLHQDTPDSDNPSRRATASARRSFFRRKKHQRSSSRDSKELASFSNTQLSYFSDSGLLNDENTINSYIRMERLDCKSGRGIVS